MKLFRKVQWRDRSERSVLNGFYTSCLWGLRHLCLLAFNFHAQQGQFKHRGCSCLGQQVDRQPQPWCLLYTLELVRAIPTQPLTPLRGWSQRLQWKSSLLSHLTIATSCIPQALPSLSEPAPLPPFSPPTAWVLPASHFEGSNTVFGLQYQEAPNSVCYLAVRSSTVQLWAEQLPVFGSPTMHKPVKARRYTHPHPTLNVQLVQCAID